MTLPFERKNSILMARTFLLSLCDSSQTPRVPKYIRDQARSVLKHYPGEYQMEEASKKVPEIFGDFNTWRERQNSE